MPAAFPLNLHVHGGTMLARFITVIRATVLSKNTHGLEVIRYLDISTVKAHFTSFSILFGASTNIQCSLSLDLSVISIHIAALCYISFTKK